MYVFFFGKKSKWLFLDLKCLGVNKRWRIIAVVKYWHDEDENNDLVES